MRRLAWTHTGVHVDHARADSRPLPGQRLDDSRNGPMSGEDARSEARRALAKVPPMAVAEIRQAPPHLAAVSRSCNQALRQEEEPADLLADAIAPGGPARAPGRGRSEAGERGSGR